MTVGRRADDDEVVASLRRGVGGEKADGVVPFAVARGIDLFPRAAKRVGVDVDEIDRPAEGSRRVGEMIADRTGAKNFEFHATNMFGRKIDRSRMRSGTEE